MEFGSSWFTRLGPRVQTLQSRHKRSSTMPCGLAPSTTQVLTVSCRGWSVGGSKASSLVA
jgi:hypothetical protein